MANKIKEYFIKIEECPECLEETSKEELINNAAMCKKCRSEIDQVIKEINYKKNGHNMKKLIDLNWNKGTKYCGGEFIKRPNVEVGESVILKEATIENKEIKTYPEIGTVVSIWFSGQIVFQVNETDRITAYPSTNNGYIIHEETEG